MIMNKTKSFWKKYEFLIVLMATLLFIYVLAVFHQKINFFLGNELIVYLAPQQKSFYMHYGNVSKVQFDISIDNVAYCKASCSYSFYDRSINELMDEGNFDVEKKQLFTKTYELGVKRLGSGQDIYSFDVKCHSIKAFFCLTKSSEKSRSSLVIVNYDLTETEKSLKDILKQNITKLLETLAQTDEQLQRLNQKYFELGFMINLINLSKKKIDINDAYDKTRVSIENLRALWFVENYIKLNEMFNQSFFDSVIYINGFIKILDEDIDAIAKLHDDLLFNLGILQRNINDLHDFLIVLGDNGTLNSLEINADKFNSLSYSILNNTFESYYHAQREFDSIAQQLSLISEKTKNQVAELFFALEYFLDFENNIFCNLMQNCENTASINNITNKTQRTMESYPDSELLRRSCSSLKKLNQEYSDIRSETTRAISEKNITFAEINFFAMADEFKANLIRTINNSYYDSFEKIKLNNESNTGIIKIAESVLTKNKTELKNLTYNQSMNISLYLLSKINLSSYAAGLLIECSKLDETKKIANFNFAPVSTNFTFNFIPNIDTRLPDNPPICCVFNECEPCCTGDSCRNDPKTYPVILLHGHSLARGNSPEFSLDSFNILQAKLQEDGYLNAGIVSLYSQNESLQRGIWGLSGKPVTVKASYYYDAIRRDDRYIIIPTKSENIDTYAVRLKDVINIVKERTNKPKVNIIAHSMGGLVARRYVQIFGEDDVDKLIMIATPNKGISGLIGDYCGLVGENRECEDMHENSLFINKVNDPLKQPEKTKLYAIIGQGCQMKFGNGDGVVLDENAKLENAKLFYVNGTCNAFGETLHTEILNVGKYTEIYWIITEILLE